MALQEAQVTSYYNPRRRGSWWWHRGLVRKTGHQRWTWACLLTHCPAGATYVRWDQALKATCTHASDPMWR